MSKPGALDQILMEDIARHCPQQFLAFHQCMSKPNPDANECNAEQQKLTQCIRYDVPAFQRIQGVCAGKLQGYDACLKMNKSDASKCTQDLRELRNCATNTLT